MNPLSALGLHRPELRAWALYDWANSAFMTTVITVFYPIYFAQTAKLDPSLGGGLTPGEVTARFANATTIALAVIALVSPFLGLLADRYAVRKKMLAACLLLALFTTAGLGLAPVGASMLSLVLFGLANVGASGSFVFYDALLPHVARPNEVDRVSSAGYALGYCGGGLMLTLNVAMVLKPEFFGLGDALNAMRWSFVSVAVWWAVFSLPLFLTVDEPPSSVGAEGSQSEGISGLVATFRDLMRFDQAMLMMLAFLIYNDGIGTIIRMTTAYGTEIGIDQSTLIKAILVVQFLGIPCTFLFSALAAKTSTKAAIGVALGVYGVVTWVAYTMHTATQFWILALLVALAQGGCQALSRSLFASMIPERQSSQFFAFFGVAEKFAGVLGSGIFAVIVGMSGSGRQAVLSLVVFFIIGGALLAKVDAVKGRAQAIAANEAAGLRTETEGL